MILFVDKDTTLFRSSSICYRGWLYLDQIDTLTASFLKDACSQLDKGNKAAGLRARRASLELEPLLKRFRKLSLEAANNKAE